MESNCNAFLRLNLSAFSKKSRCNFSWFGICIIEASSLSNFKSTYFDALALVDEIRHANVT